MTGSSSRSGTEADPAAALVSAREQQAAVADILRVISRSPKDLQAVFDVIARSARRFCSAEDAMVALVEGDRLVSKAHDGPVQWVAGTVRLDRQLPAAGCIVDRRTIHVSDMQTDTDYALRTAREIAMKYGIRTVLATPMLHDGKAIGSITLRRNEVLPFTDEQIELVRTFADQAAIAIENVRLYNDTKDALDQQTATADVLKTISRSAFDLQAVFDVVVENATKLCRGEWGYLFRKEGEVFRLIATHGGTPALIEYERAHPTVISDRTLIGRVALRRSVVHIPDLFEDPDYDWPTNREHGVHTVLGVPIFRDDEVVGAIGVARNERRPFSDADIRLVQTFADQATIAMENVRLFNETRESLGQQTALSDVLRTISRSAFDLDAVLQTIVERAAALVGAETAAISRREGDEAVVLAQFGRVFPALVPGTRIPLSETTLIGRALSSGKRQYVADTIDHSDLPQTGPRTRLVIPFLRDGKAIGTLGVSHSLPKPFDDRELQMLETFADQAAIAIENVRLFNETKESLERQTALAEILRVIASSPSDQQPVFDAVATNAARYCGAEDAVVLLVQGDAMLRVAHHGPIPTAANPSPPLVRTGVVGRAVLDGRAVHVADIMGPAGDEFPSTRVRAAEVGDRGILATPLLREGTAIGVILLRKRDTNGFTPSQMRLVEAFADQAVIAIENVRLFNETKEALERQTAISEILRAIANSPGNEKPVLATIAHSATTFCGAADASILLINDGKFGFAAHHGPVLLGSGSFSVPMTRESVAGHAVMDRRTVQVADVLGPEGDAYPPARGGFTETGQRAILATPLLREHRALGAIVLRKTEPGAFSANQVSLVEAFADQAVIAIENVRLFNETKEALERQTATSEVLKTISRAPFELQPILDTLVQNAARLTLADNADLVSFVDGNLRDVAQFGSSSEEYRRIIGEAMNGSAYVPRRGTIVGRTLLEGRLVHVVDVLEDTEYEWHEAQAAGGFRTVLGVPLMRQDRPIGVIVVWRQEVKPFTDMQIELLTTFADQAVIAMENVRLFNETKEALDRQTATSSILNVISRSPADQQPTLDAIVESGARLCDAEMAFVYVVEHGFFKLRAGYKVPPAFVDRTNADPIPVTAHRGSLSGRVVAERRAVQIPDVLADAEYTYVEGQRLVGYRAMLNVPMFSKGELIGLIGLWRTVPIPFTTKQIDLMSTFADQAVIAIENTRLFNETKEALEQQTAVGEVLKTISRSAFDLQPVLDIVLNNAVRLAGADIGWLSRVENEQFMTVAYSANFPEAVIEELARQRAQGQITPWVPLGTGGGLMGFTLAEGRTVHLPDVKVDPELKGSVVARLTAARTVVGVPMLRDGRSIGGMVLARYDVRPYGERELELVQTFADQAAIAIENVRLFDETKEALEQQSAISEVLKTISGTVFDLQPTLQTVVENAAKLADADVAWMMQSVDDRSYSWGARYGRTPELEALFGERGPHGRVIEIDRVRPSIMGRVYTESRSIVVQDVEADPELLEASRVVRATKSRSLIGVPVMSEGIVAGAIVLGRLAVRPFAEREVQLVETFADQAAIAIRNVRLFNEIQDKSRQLEVASRHKSEFLANMSHELRTPLNAIIGFSEVLMEGLFGDVNEKQREYLKDVVGSGQHLLSLINDILDLSKIEAGRMELELSSFSFGDALASGVTIVRERASRHNITLSVASDEIGQVEADERKLKQILYNLLSNAVKFTPDGGRVDVTVRRDNGEVRVEVRDNGIGIAHEDQARIFEEFQQVGRERSREGTGLGLTLTKRFVELHGGRIWVESAPGQGSTFAFTLPLRQAAAVRS